MMAMRIHLGAAMIAVLAALGAGAQDKPCPPADSAKAAKEVDRVVNWDQLYKAFKQYGYCDSGAVDDIFTDALLRCIVEWKNVEGLAKPMESDRPYRDFVHRHLNSPAAKGDLDSVYSRAKMSCPKGLESFCADIAMSAKPFAGMEIIRTDTDSLKIPDSAPKK
jgi:hypothetical protein